VRARFPTTLVSCLASVLWLCTGAAQDTVLAQGGSASAAGSGAISGTVIDAPTGTALAGARVSLLTVALTGPAGSRRPQSTHAEAVRVTLTGSQGTYLFEPVEPGVYRVQVDRPGYSPAQVQVDVREGGSARVTIGLQVLPISIEPLVVVGHVAQPFVRQPSPRSEVVDARVATARRRQATYLAGDAVELTPGDVREAVTLGESDIFRTLQRIPGVSRRDDYTAVLWTRGAPWVQTRVYFDGMPLFNPTHGGWLFSSVNPDAIGSAVFHPGVRSAEWGDGAAGIVDLRSRSGLGRHGTSGAGELSLASGRLSGDGSLFGRVGWMVAARRTYVDVVTRTWEFIKWEPDAYIPYNFSDLSARLDLDLGRIVLIASGTTEHDKLRGDIPRMLEGNEAQWGNRAGRVTASVPVGPVVFSGTRGGTRFRTEVHEDTLRYRRRWPGESATLPAMNTEIDYDVESVRLERAAGRRNGSAPGVYHWAIGHDWIRESMRYSGPYSLTGEGIPGLKIERANANLRASMRRRAAWGELRVHPSAKLEVQAGLRVETGEPILNSPETRHAPRILARWSADESTWISAGWGRSFQYVQANGAAAGPFGPQLHLSNQWALAYIGSPVIRSDIVSVGAERWIGSGYLVTGNAYSRRADGISERDPRPGPIQPTPLYVHAVNEARGLELSVRRLSGRWTGSLGSSLAASDMHVDTVLLSDTVRLRYPSSADVRFGVDATSGFALSPDIRLGAAFSFASGTPYTPVLVADEPMLEMAGSRRGPAYASLDLVTELGFRIGAWDGTAYLQLVNALDRENRVTYYGSEPLCPVAASGSAPIEPCEGVRDRFKSGLPRLPLFGIRISF
jgi:hypothetical protein